MSKYNWIATGLGALGGAVLAMAVFIALNLWGIIPDRSNETFRNYLLANPKVLLEASEKLQAIQQAEENRRRQALVDKVESGRLFDQKVAFVAGPKDAKHSLIEFYDYNCPYCRESNSAVRDFYQHHKNDTRFAFFELPIKGDASITASRASVAIAIHQPEKFMAFHFAVMDEKTLADETLVMQIAKKVGVDIARLKKDMQDPAINERLKKSIALAKDLGVEGTPTFLIDGQLHPGLIDSKALAEARNS